MADFAVTRNTLPVGSSDGRETGWWGMLTVIATEGALFAYLLFGYYYFAAQFGRSWLPAQLPEFRLSLPNTLILIASSGAAWWGERGARNGSRRQAILGLAGAIVLGSVFAAVQLLEWSHKDFNPATHSYGSFYFIVTGFHLAHVAVGIVMLLGVLIWSLLGYFDRHRHAPVSIATVYWHFVDVVWLAVFFTFYVTPRLG